MEFQNYEVLRSIGIGATSEVFEAINKTDQKHVALKKFSPLVAHDLETRRRLELEVETLSVLHHPNIVALRGTFTEGNSWGIELELVQGSHLKQWNEQYDLNLIEPKVWILAQVAKGLGAAHEQGILHRDLKPENILVSETGEVKITDFGLARSLSRVTVTKSGLLIGSLAYMAPEVINLQDASTKSDIFSFGVIAYDLLAKKSPFGSETPQGVIRAITEGKFLSPQEVNPIVPKFISDLVVSCLNPNPEKRPSSIWHIEAELMSYLSRLQMVVISKKLVANVLRQESLQESLKLKRARLLEVIEGEKSSMTERMAALNELRLIFPQDNKAQEFIERLQTEKQGTSRKETNKNRVKRASVIVIVLAGALITWQLAKYSETNESPKALESSKVELAAEVIKSEATETKVPVARASEPSSKLTKTSKPKILSQKPSELMGTIRFILSEDVDVFVGGQYVPPSRRSSFTLPAGKHLVKMVKEGFMPIEHTVNISPGKTSVINVGGN